MILVAAIDLAGGFLASRLDASRPERDPVPVRSVEQSPPTFDAVYTEYFAHVARWLRAFGAPPADLDDLTQEVFLVVRRKLSVFDGQNPRAWLYRITQRTASDFRRRAWFRRLARRAERDPDGLPSSDRDPHAALERRQAAQLVARMLAKMSPIRRTAFVLFEIEGYSAPEIAELEGIPVNTVYTRLHHARHDFLRLVAEATGDPMVNPP